MSPHNLTGSQSPHSCIVRVNQIEFSKASAANDDTQSTSIYINRVCQRLKLPKAETHQVNVEAQNQKNIKIDAPFFKASAATDNRSKV